jgi:glucokinase
MPGRDPAPEVRPSELVLALDYGGSKLTAAVAERGGGASDGWRGSDGGRGSDDRRTSLGWRAIESIRKPAGADGCYDRETMTGLARRLLAGAPVVAVGVSFGGPVIVEEGLVRRSHHVVGWHDTPLATQLEEAFGAPCRIDNDGNAGALGEYRFGAGQGVHSLLYVTVSTGVGGGWILRGSVWRGFEGMAGEFGHMTVDPDGPPCVCGRHGCVERFAAGPNLADHAQRLLRDHPDEPSPMRAPPQDGAALTAADVAQAAAAGDRLARIALDASAGAVGVAIGSTANLMNPQRFVVGGGVAKAGERYWQTLVAAAAAHCMPEITLDIVPAALGDEAPLWGAVALAEEALDAGGDHAHA